MTARKPPHDLACESSLLGAMLLSTEAIRASTDVLAPADFYEPRHGMIYAAMVDLHGAGAPVDPVTVAAELDRRGILADVGGRQRILRIQAATPASANAAQYVAVVAEAATLRRAIGVADSISAAAYAGQLHGVEEILTGAQDRLAAPIAQVEPADDLGVLLADAEDQPAPDWLIPGCFARSERFMLTGQEGLGKSTMLRQLAVQMACGIHPFDLDDMPRRLCLHVDMENSRAQSAAEYARIATPAVRGRYEPGWLVVKRRQQGIDLTARGDVRWLEALIVHHKPDVLLIGPLYKMMRGTDRRSIHSEESAAEAANALDLLRVRYNLAMLIEAHSPHQAQNTKRRDLRPIGASLWLRWPEFGYGLAGSDTGATLGSWRLDRVRGRRWPRKLVQGQAWPWQTEDASISALIGRGIDRTESRAEQTSAF